MTTASPQEIARKLGSGLLSFPVTHLREDGSFDEPAYRENIGWLVSSTHPACSPRAAPASFLAHPGRGGAGRHRRRAGGSGGVP